MLDRYHAGRVSMASMAGLTRPCDGALGKCALPLLGVQDSADFFRSRRRRRSPWRWRRGGSGRLIGAWAWRSRRGGRTIEAVPRRRRRLRQRRRREYRRRAGLGSRRQIGKDRSGGHGWRCRAHRRRHIRPIFPLHQPFTRARVIGIRLRGNAPYDLVWAGRLDDRRQRRHDRICE